MTLLTPDQYPETPPYELLQAAARGHAAIDHRFLHALLDNPERALPEIVRFSLDDHSGDLVDLSAELLAIFGAYPVVEALPFLMNEIERFPEDVPEYVLAPALIKIGEPAVDALLEVGEPKGDIAFLLASLDIRDQRIFQFLVGYLDEDPEDGAFLCEIYNDPALAPHLEAVRERAPDEVEDALTALGTRKPVPWEPFDIWSEYPARAVVDAADLPEQDRLLFLESPSVEQRLSGIEAWAEEELPPKVVTRLLAIARSDPEDQLRGAAWEALRIEYYQDRVATAMSQRLAAHDMGPLERAGLVAAMAMHEDPAAMEPAILATYEYEPTRAKALEAMWRSRSKRFQDYVIRHLSDNDPDLVREAICGVGFLELASEVDRLSELFAAPGFREDALFNYMLAAPADVTRAGMLRLRSRLEGAAGGFSEGDAEVVDAAIEMRLEFLGVPASTEPEPAKSVKVGRNDPCPCGSGKKYKKCCLA